MAHVLSRSIQGFAEVEDTSISKLACVVSKKSKLDKVNTKIAEFYMKIDTLLHEKEQLEAEILETSADQCDKLMDDVQKQTATPLLPLPSSSTTASGRHDQILSLNGQEQRKDGANCSKNNNNNDQILLEDAPPNSDQDTTICCDNTTEIVCMISNKCGKTPENAFFEEPVACLNVKMKKRIKAMLLSCGQG